MNDGHGLLSSGVQVLFIVVYKSKEDIFAKQKNVNLKKVLFHEYRNLKVIIVFNSGFVRDVLVDFCIVLNVEMMKMENFILILADQHISLQNCVKLTYYKFLSHMLKIFDRFCARTEGHCNISGINKLQQIVIQNKNQARIVPSPK